MGADVASGATPKAVALGVRVSPPMLVIEWPDGGRVETEMPLSGGATPCQYVAVIGQVVAPERRCAAWWIEP